MRGASREECERANCGNKRGLPKMRRKPLSLSSRNKNKLRQVSLRNGLQMNWEFNFFPKLDSMT